MSSIIYSYGKNMYINLTNKCPCDCTFCIRQSADGLGSAGSLWLEEEPSARQVALELEKWKLARYGEIIFCGYGEPFCALDTLLETCRRLRGAGAPPLRVNTNGLGDLINGKPTAPLLCGLLDTVSISLNAPNAQSYAAMCRPQYGIGSYDAMIKFAVECKEYVPRVVFTVVDILPQAYIAECRSVAAAAGIPLRVRASMS